MREITLKKFFEDLGYNISDLSSDLEQINLYSQWYNGFVESFHRYYVFNGDKKVFKNRYSLNMPKKICENFADLIMNSKTSITLSSDKSTELLKKIFLANNFFVKANQAIEKSFALGMGAFLLSIDKDLGIRIQFVSAKNIIPLSFDSFDITECAFVSDEISSTGEVIKNVQVHRLDKNREYIISNYRFIVRNGDNLSPLDIKDISASIRTNSTLPWFSFIRPNTVNNINIDSPFGLPVYANCLDTIKSLDIIFDSFVNEIQNGRKRLFVTAEALKVNAKGKLGHAFDPNDVVFYLLDGNIGNENKYVQEVNGTLRIQELRLALQTNLEILTIKLGFGKNCYQLGDYQFEKTATEVVSSNSDLFRTVHKHEILIAESIKKLIKSIQYISKTYFGTNIDGESYVDFDDSVIESDAERRAQDRLDVSMGAMSLAEYRSKWYGESIELAKEMINEVKEERSKNNV